MKSNLYKTSQNVILRWLMSAAVLFYVLVPQVGACHCSACHCCEHSDSQEVAAVITDTIDSTEPAGCCCSKESAAPKKETKHDNDSDSCPCLLQKTSDQPDFVLPSAISLQNVSDEWLTDGYLPFVSSILPTTVTKIVSIYNLYESPTSRLAVRLHLLLLVLLN